MFGIEGLSRQPKSLLVTSGLLLVGLFWYFDYVTGSELASEIFYLIPISLITWMVGQWPGYLTCALSAVAWFAADAMCSPSYAHPLIPYWNALVRFGGFILVSHILGAARVAMSRREDLTHFIVHDLRSPLTGITFGLRNLQRSATERKDEKDKEEISVCDTSCQRMLELINSLLDLARIESGKMPLQPSAIIVGQLVESCLRDVASWAEENQVTLHSQVEPTVPHAFADPSLTTRILVNLLANAIQVSPLGSSVTLRVVPAGSDRVSFSVSDQGPGIPKEWAKRVFNKFDQGEARKAGGAVGSGLGLTFCRYAVEAQGGRIWLASELGQGTTVTFTLPAAAATAEQSPSK